MNLTKLKKAIIEGSQEKSSLLTKELIEHGLDPTEILNDSMIPAMEVVGNKFNDGEYFVPEMLMSASAMKSGMNILKPLLSQSGIKPKAKILMGTVKGDMHDIGKNLVIIMLEGGGFEVIDAGVDVSLDSFIELAQSNDVDFIGMSALLTTTREQMRTVIDGFSESNIRDKFKFIIGGAPVTQKYADEIGADGYSKNAANAVELVSSLL